MFGLSKKDTEVINAPARVHAALTRPSPTPMKAVPMGVEIDEYAEVAKTIGLDVPDVKIEPFLRFMEKRDLPIYSLAEVVPYMDALAKRDGLGYGWEWRPVRAKDHMNNARFGTMPRSRMIGIDEREQEPVSDYYIGPSSSGIWMVRSPSVYDKKIPLHALKRIALIESEYKDHNVHFFVSDYATQPSVRPDPFLLAVLGGVSTDIGRFVIDFWDEPGFGIAQMVAK